MTDLVTKKHPKKSRRGKRVSVLMNKYKGKSKILLSHTPLKRMCSHFASHYRPDVMFTRGFLAAMKANVQKHCIDRLQIANKYASFNNKNVDESNQPMLVSEQNMLNVVCTLGERAWPPRMAKKEPKAAFKNKSQLLENLNKPATDTTTTA
jgi:hypothetical protein